MSFRANIYITAAISVLILSGCGGGGSSGSVTPSAPPTPTPPAADTTVPSISFSPANLEVESGMSGTSTVTATDNLGVTTGPSVECTNGGSFSGSTFTAPAVSVDTTSVCTATAGDAAGNESTAILTVSITPIDTEAPSVSFSPDNVTVESGMTVVSTLTTNDNVGVTTGPSIECTNGGSFSDSTFTAPAVTTNTTSICTATAIDAAGNVGNAALTVSITPTVPVVDIIAPTVSFGTTPTTISSGESMTLNVSVNDDVGVTSGPTITCDDIGEISGTTFTAPSVMYDQVAICSATASDAAGNTGSATLNLKIDAPVEVILDRAQVFESGLFNFVKTSPPGSIEIIQLSGAEAIEFLTFSEEVSFRAPALDFDGTEQLSFEIKINGPDGQTASEVITAPEVTGRAGAGIPVAVYEPALSLLNGFVRLFNFNGNVNGNVLATRQSSESFNSDKVELALFGGTTNIENEQNYESEGNYQVEGIFEDISYAELSGLGFSFALTVLSKIENELRWFNFEPNAEGSPPNIFREADSFSIENPCFVRSLFGQDYVWIGQENNGFSVVEIEPITTNGLTTGFDETILQNIGGTRSLCYIFPTRLAFRFANSGPDGLITLDYNTNEIVLFKELNQGAAYEEVEAIALETETNEALQIVDVYSFGLPSRGSSVYRRFVDEWARCGEHRFIQITQNREGSLDDDEVQQRTYSWTGGVPVSLVVGNFGGEDTDVAFTEDVVVITSSNQSLFFEANTPSSSDRSTRNRGYAQPVFFETLPGAGSAVSINQRSTNDEGVDIDDVLVSYPETGELRYYTPDSTLPKFQPPRGN